MNEQKYKTPMEPWPDLEKYSRETYLKGNQLSLFYYEAGENEPENLIMIHGLGDEADTWRYMVEPLAEKFHVYALDLPGFGRSDKPDRDYSPQFFLKVLEEFMHVESIKTTFLMGSSLGAILSQEFALQYPEKVKGLILLDGALIQNVPMVDWSLRLMQVPLLGEWLYTRLRKNPDAAFESLSNVYHDLGSLPEQDRDFLFKRVNKRVWSDGQRRAYFSTLRSLTKWVKASQDGLQERLRRENIPTLVVRGEFDPLFPVENADAVIEAQTNAEKVIIKDAGHLPHQETPKVVVKTVKNWLQKFD